MSAPVSPSTPVYSQETKGTGDPTGVTVPIGTAGISIKLRRIATEG